MSHRVISDLDGCIALDQHRRHHLEGETKNWPAYFGACADDAPNWAVIRTLKAYSAMGLKIHILTGRSETVAEETVAWLDRHLVPYDTLDMRGADDRTADHIMKPQVAEEYDWTPDDVLVVLEDRSSVVKAWRERGYSCFQVEYGDF